MKLLALSEQAHAALMQLAEKNYRTPELQIMYWLSKEGSTIEMPKLLPQQIQVTTKKVSTTAKKKAGWTPEKRAAQAERIRQYWANGKLTRKTNGLDHAASGRFDD